MTVTLTEDGPHRWCMEDGQACSCSEVTGVTLKNLQPGLVSDGGRGCPVR